jgi:hypothetical protein
MKKSLLLALVAALFLFAACGDKKESETEHEPERTDSDIAENQETADEDSANSEPTDDTEQTDGDSENIENQDVSDEDVNQDNLICTQESKETLGGEGCRYRIKDDPTRHVEIYCGCDSFKVDNVACDDGNKCVLSGECGEGRCSIEFRDYDKELFDAFPLEREIFTKFRNEPTGVCTVARLKNGTLLAAVRNGTWISELAPEIIAEQKIIPTCENVCIETNESWMDEPYYDYVYYPPVEFTIGENAPVLVSNGQVVVFEGYEYYVYGSETISPDDPDHKLYHREESEMPDPNYGIFNFVIVNTNALK